MFPAQIPVINPDDFSRCNERRQAADPGKSLSPTRKTDAALEESLHHAFWKDDVLRAIEHDELGVHVNMGIVHLNGHIVGTTSQSRIMNAIRAVPGILGIQNNLILDDKLTLEVAASLGKLEHTYDCKFFTGASHGIISLNGTVRDEDVRSLAEKHAASNPNVRGVINNLHVSGAASVLQEQPFLQPTIGAIIYFLDGNSGIVKQVIINPNDRRVTAMTVLGNFNEQRNELHSLADGKARPSEQLIVVPMKIVRYLTRISGFLYINSHERTQYQDFDPVSFYTPNWDWTPPYPYCPDDVLFPVEQREVEYRILEQLPRPTFTVALQEQALRGQLLANDSLGG